MKKLIKADTSNPFTFEITDIYFKLISERFEGSFWEPPSEPDADAYATINIFYNGKLIINGELTWDTLYDCIDYYDNAEEDIESYASFQAQSVIEELVDFEYPNIESDKEQKTLDSIISQYLEYWKWV